MLEPSGNIQNAGVGDDPGATPNTWGHINYLLQWQSSDLSHLYDNPSWIWTQTIKLLLYQRGKVWRCACMVRQQIAVSYDAHGAAVDCLNHFISYPHRNPVAIDFAYESVPACVSHNYDPGLACRDFPGWTFWGGMQRLRESVVQYFRFM